MCRWILHLFIRCSNAVKGVRTRAKLHLTIPHAHISVFHNVFILRQYTHEPAQLFLVNQFDYRRSRKLAASIVNLDEESFWSVCGAYSVQRVD